MNKLRFSASFFLACFVVATFCCHQGLAQDWPALRGNDGQGSVQPKGILSKTSDVALKVRWKTKIGSGYSSVVVADGIVVALHTGKAVGPGRSPEKEDFVVGFDSKTGMTLWRYSLGPGFIGKNGSFDGPLATPIVHEGMIYGLSPTGRLFCLKLKTGEDVWARELKNDENAPQPMYGFTTSPIVAGGALIVQLGAKGKAIAGIDLKTGATKWAVGNDRIDSQTPYKANIGGREIVLACGGKYLMGVDPNNGEIVFEYEHKGGNGSSMTPVPIGDDKFLLTLDDSFSKAISVQPKGETFHVSEDWKDRSIKNTYNIPVFVDGNVFAYSTRILTCVNPETGKAHWKSRAPGDGFLIAVDNHLIVSTKKGSLHIAKASADEYLEVAGAKIFDDLVWSVPAYSENAIFVRSLGGLTRVDIVATAATTATVQKSQMPIGKKFAEFIASVNAAKTSSEKTGLVDSLLEATKTTPIVEDDVVHFVYRGKEKDLAVASDLFGARQERKMIQLDGTDFFYYSVKLPKDQRANYIFLADYQPILDPRNTRKNTSSLYAGEMEFAIRLRSDGPLKMSWFAMPNWQQPKYLPIPEKMAGRIEEKTVESEDGKTKQKIEVYLPPSYDAAAIKKYPVAYVFGGAAARRQGKVAEIADSIFQKKMAPECVLVFITTNPMAPPNPNLMPKMIVPFIDKNYLTMAERKGRLCVGFSFDSASALTALASSPDLFGAASVQSPLIFDAVRESLLSGLEKVDQPTNLRIEWGRYDMFNPHENWDMRTMTQSFVDEAKKFEHLKVNGEMVNDSTDWSSWRNRLHLVFKMLSAE